MRPLPLKRLSRRATRLVRFTTFIAQEIFEVHNNITR